MVRYELNENDVIVIRQMIDISLKAGGLQNLNAATRILTILQRPLPEEKKEVKDKNDE